MTAVAGISSSLAGGSWAQGGPSAFQADFSSPGGYVSDVVGWALEYISPLQDWMDNLTGDKGEVAGFASSWRAVGVQLADVEAELRSADGRLDELEGRAARALRKRVDELRGHVRDTAEWTAASAEALELASDIVTAVHDATVGAISELMGLAVDLLGFELSLSSLNPFDRLEKLQHLVDRAMDYIGVVRTLIERMFDAFEQLLELIRSLGPLIADAMRELANMIAAIAPGVGLALGGPIGWLVGGGLSTLLQKDARVTELLPRDLTEEQLLQYEAANTYLENGLLTDPSQFIQQNGYTDRMGESGAAVVDIKKVLGPDGTYHWVVSLPSTQDWNIPGDAGAPNDLNTNVALMIMENPALKTQYERAVLQAMQDAGIPHGADVVYTGFSQGGIMAANLASDPASPYHPIGVVTNGSPIDTFDIPEDVVVLSYQHTQDPVPTLDLNAQGQSGGHHHVIEMDPRTFTDDPDKKAPVIPARDAATYPVRPHEVTLGNPTPGMPPQSYDVYNPMDTHNNDNYVASARGYDDEYRHYMDVLGGQVVDQQQHTFRED